MKSFDDKVFIKRLQYRDPQALREVIKHYHPRFKYLVMAMVGEGAHEDVLQEAWCAVFKNIAQFQGKSKFSTWLYRVIINQAKMHLRKPLELSLGDDFADKGFKKDGHWQTPPKPWHISSPEELVQNHQLCDKINRIINKLLVMQQATLVMHDIEGVKMQEICNILHLSASNERVLLHRARNTVYHQIEDNQ